MANSISNPGIIIAKHPISCLYDTTNIFKPNEVMSKFHLPLLSLFNLVSTLQASLLELFYQLDNIEKDFNDTSENPSIRFLADLTDIESLPV